MSEFNEIDMLQGLVPELEAEGYEVFPRPKKLLLPAFLREFRPHVVAFRKDKNLVVEVIGKSIQSAGRIEQLTALMKERSGWDFRVILVSSAGDQEPLTVQGPKSMQSRIDEVRRLAEAGHSEPAILLAFATFEALGRVALSKQFERPQTPGRLSEGLAHEGVGLCRPDKRASWMNIQGKGCIHDSIGTREDSRHHCHCGPFKGEYDKQIHI